ncbi:MAG TPA: nuclear transport factor 2 family protein [Thermoplasmata archaeon]|nr:nuclear transport factor 2 family protein [Thermoplasmata archaeon]
MVVGSPSTEQLKERVKSYLELVDSGRYDELFAHLSAGVVYQTIRGRPPIVGASDLIRFYKETRPPGSGVHEVAYFIAEDGKVACLLRMKGVLGDGSTLAFEAVDLFTFEGGKIVSIRTFSDLPPALPGYAPPPSAP